MISREESSKRLVKNIGFLSISQFSTKILTFFLVPLYTSILSTNQYGVYDLFTTTIGLLIPIFTLHIVEAVLRFSLEPNRRPTDVFTNGIVIESCGGIVLSVFILVNKFTNIIPAINEYLVYFILMFIAEVIYQFFTYFSRGINDVLAISIAGIISTVVVISTNIVFLLVLKKGLEGYFLATILGNISAMIFLFFRLKIWKYICIKSIEYKLCREMLGYSAPLILNQISWWINNASDRYIVIAVCGVAANGVYSIGYKIPNILSTLQGIFNSSWVLSATQDYDENDSKGFFSSTYATYNFLMTVTCSLIIVMTKLIAKLLYAKEFFEAWKYVPFLTIAVVFGALSGYLGGIFTAVKDTKAISLTTLFGAIINICLNFLLVNRIGPLGAAIATMLSGYAIFVVRYIWSKKYIKFKINFIRDNLSYCLLLIQSLLLLFLNDILLISTQCVLSLFVVLLYNKEIKAVLELIFNKLYHNKL